MYHLYDTRHKLYIGTASGIKNVFIWTIKPSRRPPEKLPYALMLLVKHESMMGQFK